MRMFAAPIGVEVTQKYEHEGTPGDMPEDAESVPALRLPPGERERHGHTDHEGEGGLNQVPKSAAFPWRVVHLTGQPGPARVMLEHAEPEAVRDQQQHDKAAISVQTQQRAGTGFG